MIGKLILKKIFGVPDKKEFFCRNKSHNAIQRCVPQWVLLFICIWNMLIYHLVQQTFLANLQNGGLAIMDERKAFAFLENVSYFRYGRKLVETNLTA